MNINVKYIMSGVAIVLFIVLALAQTSSDTKGRKFEDDLCRRLKDAVTYEADIFTSVIDKETSEPVPGVEIRISVYHYEAVYKNNECTKKFIWDKRLTEVTNEHGVVTFRPGTFVFLHELDMVQVIVTANLNDQGFHKKTFFRNHEDIGGIDVTFKVLDKESL